MVSEFAVQAILKKCVNKIINIEVKLCATSTCVFYNVYIGSVSFFMRIMAQVDVLTGLHDYDRALVEVEAIRLNIDARQGKSVGISEVRFEQ